jgi:hypothetical protein
VLPLAYVSCVNEIHAGVGAGDDLGNRPGAEFANSGKTTTSAGSLSTRTTPSRRCPAGSRRRVVSTPPAPKTKAKKPAQVANPRRALSEPCSSSMRFASVNAPSP